MSDADVRRSTPGYVYGVAMHSTGEVETFTPECACPCHLADAPYPASWYCGRCYAGIMRMTTADKPRVPYTHEQAIADGTTNPRQPMRHVVDYYFITKGNSLDDALGEHFKTSEQAKSRAEELNTEDAIASLGIGPAFVERRQRLKELGPTFRVRYGEGHPETRWPESPGRYALLSFSERYSEAFWETVDSLADVEAEILSAGDDVERVVDLDTGEDLDFAVAVTIMPRFG